MLLTGKKGTYSFTPTEKSSVLRGNGKFSIIYKGENTDDQSPVVIKMLHPKWNTSSIERRRFVAEYINAKSDIIFPGMIDICENGANLYIIREYIAGRDLTSYEKDKPLAEAVKREGKETVVLKILDAFIRLQHHRIIHGDIKPSNIMLTLSHGEIGIKIIDTGLSLPEDHSLQRNPENPLPFSLIYAPPELMLNYAELIRPSSDVYSLAMTIYEFLTGEKPLDFTHPALMMSVQLNEQMSSHRKINSATLEVLNTAAFKFKFPKPIQNYSIEQVRKSLASAMICRYQNMYDFKSALSESFNKKDGLLKKIFGK